MRCAMTFRRWRLHPVLLLSFSCRVFAQYSQGQFFTPGLAIISSPQPNSQEHVGSTLSISITVGGNKGQLTDFTPGASTTSGTGYDNLELFLVSASENINISVASNILTREQGSNVKHVPYQIPSCVPTGSYNLSLYESSRFNNDAIFTITQVPLAIQNKQPSGQTCPDNQIVQQQPQADTPLSGSPWLGTVSRLTSGGVATLASTNNVLLASNPPPTPQQQTPSQPEQPQPEQPQPQAQGAPSDSSNQDASSSQQGASQAASSSASAVFETSRAEDQPTPTANPGQPVVVQTVTVTSNVILPTLGANMNNGGGGILFPVSTAYRTAERSTRWTITLFVIPIIYSLLT